jgi:hypothetical protein
MSLIPYGVTVIFNVPFFIGNDENVTTLMTMYPDHTLQGTNHEQWLEKVAKMCQKTPKL